MLRRRPRIVNVASIGQQAIDFSDVMLTKDYNGMRAYRQSKLAQVLFTFDLAAELDPDGVTVNALHPATFMPTKIVSSPISTIAQGVEATMRLIAARDAETGTGRFYNSLDEGRANDQAYDLAVRRQLRELSEQLTGLLQGRHRRLARQGPERRDGRHVDRLDLAGVEVRHGGRAVRGQRHVPREQPGPDVTDNRGAPGQRGRHVHHV